MKAAGKKKGPLGRKKLRSIDVQQFAVIEALQKELAEMRERVEVLETNEAIPADDDDDEEGRVTSPVFFNLSLARLCRVCAGKDSFRPDRYGPSTGSTSRRTSRTTSASRR